MSDTDDVDDDKRVKSTLYQTPSVKDLGVDGAKESNESKMANTTISSSTRNLNNLSIVSPSSSENMKQPQTIGDIHGVIVKKNTSQSTSTGTQTSVAFKTTEQLIEKDKNMRNELTSKISELEKVNQEKIKQKKENMRLKQEITTLEDHSTYQNKRLFISEHEEEHLKFARCSK